MRRVAGISAALLAMVAACYANTLHLPLLRDSQFIIAGDPRLHELSWHNLGLILSKGYWWPTYAIPLYRPFTTLTFLVNWAVLGNQGDPLGYHLVNLALHALNTVLLFVLARRLFAAPGVPALAPAFVAALFAVHPLQTEAVTYLVGRSDELVAFALLAGLICHRRAAETSGRLRLAWLALLGPLSFVGAFSKETGVLLVGVLVLHDLLFVPAPLSSATLRSRGLAYLVTLPAVVAFGIARTLAVGHDPAFLGWPFVDNPLVDAPLLVRVLTAMKVFALQVGLLVFPRSLSADYSYDAIPLYGAGRSTFDDAQCWLGVALAIAMLLGAFLARRRAPVAAFGLLLFLSVLLPTSNLLVPTGSIFAERFLYAPSIGFFLVVGSGLAALLRTRVPVRAVQVTVGVVLLGLGFRAYGRNEDWSDDLTLWQRTVEAQPRSFRAQGGLSQALAAQAPSREHLDAAIAAAQRGVDILDSRPLPIEDHDDTLYTALAHDLRLEAELQRQDGDSPEATHLLERAWDLLQRAKEIDVAAGGRVQAARRHAEGPKAGAIEVGNYAIYLELFAVAADLQRWPEATAAAEQARALAPLDPHAHLDLARVRLTEGRLDDAALDTVEALIVDGGNHEAWRQLQTLYSALGEEHAIRQQGARLTFDAAIPLVRTQINHACGELIALLVAAGSNESAQVLYQRAIDPADLAVPADQLAAPP